MLILGGLGRLRQDLVALHLTGDGQGVDIAPAAAAHSGAEVDDPLALVRGGAVVVPAGRGGGFGLFFHGMIPPFPG